MNQQDQGAELRSGKPYTTPTLTTFGKLVQLTNGNSGYGMDTNGGRAAASAAGHARHG
jgi:hypothetical protein